MDSDKTAKQATSAATLEQQIMDPNVSKNEREWWAAREIERLRARDFVTTLDTAQRGFNAWAAKPHNAKWVKMIDGTPIPNDLVVCIAEAFREAGQK